MPTAGPVAVVHGTATIAGAPLGQPAWLEFYPDAHTVGDPAFVRIDALGAFRADAVPVGKVQARLKVLKPELLPPATWPRLAECLGNRSKQTLDVPAEGRRFDLDLAAP